MLHPRFFCPYYYISVTEIGWHIFDKTATLLSVGQCAVDTPSGWYVLIPIINTPFTKVLSAGGSIGIRSDEPWTDGNEGTIHSYFDGSNWDATAWNVTLKQDITLPAGQYQLTAMGRSSQDVTLTLFVDEEGTELGQEMAHIGASGGLFGRGWEQTSIEFELDGRTTVGIGVRGETGAQYNWMSFSEFRLVQFPADPTGISSFSVDEGMKKEGKFMEHGRVVIYHDGKKFSPTGIQMK